MLTRRFAVAPLALICLLASAAAAHAQREMYGMGTSTAQDQRNQLETEARQHVSALLADYESAWGSRDARALAQLYARDAVLRPGEGGVWTGRDSLAAYFARLLPSVVPMRTRIVEFRLGSDIAYVTLATVRQRPLSADSLLETTGTDVMLLQRDPLGDWSIVWHLVRPEHVARRPVPRAPPPRPANAAADSGARTGAGGEAEGATSEEVRRGFFDLMERWKESRANGDSAGPGALFTDDALLVFVDGTPLRGRAAIARWSAGTTRLDSLRMSVETVRASGAMAYVSGRFALFDRQASEGGTFVAVLVREPGGWRIHSQVFVPDARH